MRKVLPEQYYNKVFDLVVNIPLDGLRQDGKRFAQFIKECQLRKDYNGMLIVFPVVAQLKDHQPQAHNKALKYCSDDNRKVISKTIREIEGAGAAALENFVEGIKSDPVKDSTLPRDGTVHQMASDALLFLEQLQNFSDVGGGMIAGQKSDGGASAAQCKRSFAQYISRCLAAISANLEAKAKYEDPALKSLFFMNNYNFVFDRLKKTELIKIVESYDSETSSRYRAAILEHKASYIKGWERVTQYCSIEGVDLQEHKLRDKDKSTVKDRFKNFNSEFEDVVAKHQRWSVPDDILREKLRSEVAEQIRPHYGMFRKTFIKKEFTTKVNKYIKYSEELLEEEIKKIFDREA